MKKLALFLVVLLSLSLFSFLSPSRAQEKTYLKSFEKDGTTLKIPTINLADSVISYIDTKDYYQFNITLSKLPPSNILSFPLETEGLTFYYQPPLDKELDLKDYAFVNETHALNEKGEVIVYRPENVVGSYAVYREDGKTGNQYTTGKLYHIYTPLIIDAKGNSIWGQLEVTKTSLTITIDEKWLAEATYPVVVDPSFGKTNIGASGNSWSSDWAVCSKATLSEDGTVTELSAYDQATSTTITATMAIYDHDSGNSRPGNIDDTSDEQSVTTTAAWYHFTVDVEETAAAYWLGIYHSGGFRMWYDTSETSDTAYKDPTESYPSFPDPFGSCSFYTRIYSFYANYTTGGAPQNVIVDLSETCVVSASLDSQKSLYREGSESVAVSASSDTQKSLYRTSTESITMTSASYTWKTLIRTAGESMTVTTTFESSKGMIEVLTELSETATVTASIIIQKAIHVVEVGTLVIVDFLDTVKHLGATLLELSETFGFDDFLEAILPTLPLTTEDVLAFAVMAFCIGAAALGISLQRRKQEGDSSA